MSGQDPEIFELFQKVLSDVRENITEDIYWNWDGRLQAAVVVVQRATNRIVNESLGRSFDDRWDIESIQNAPSYVREVVDALSGLRQRQFIYTSSPDAEGTVLYAAYWPWTNGNLISIRVSMLLRGRKPLSSEQQMVLLNRTLGANH